MRRIRSPQSDSRRKFHMDRSTRKQRTRTLTGTSILAALIVVLQTFCNFIPAIRFGPYSITVTLALAPIIIGAAVYGVQAGGVLGFVFSLVVFVTGLLGLDGGTVIYLMNANTLALLAMVFIKGTAAGYLSAVCYHLIQRKNRLLAILVAGIVCPVVNTSIFLAFMFAFYFDTLTLWTGSNLIPTIILGMTGINFLVELTINLALASTISRIIQIRK